MNQEDIVQAVRGGRTRFDWIELMPGIEVMADALKIDGVRVTVSAQTAQRCADLLGASLSTPLLEDEIYARAAVRIPAFPIPTGPNASWEQTVWHSRKIDEALSKAGAEPGELVATVGKAWILCNALAQRPGKAANYGWQSKNAPHRAVSGATPVWQPVGLAHDLRHHDYSQTMRLVRARGDLPTHEGRLIIRRQPGVPVERDTAPSMPVFRESDTDIASSLSLGERALRWSREEMRARPKPDAARRREFFARCMREKNGQLVKLGITDGNWCAAAACMATYEALLPGDVPPHLYRASGLELERDAVRLGAWIPIADVRAREMQPEPGDLAILHRGQPASWLNSWERHVARVEDWVSATGRFVCLDGNGAGSSWQRVARAVDNPALRGFISYARKQEAPPVPRVDPELERLLALAQAQAVGVDWAEMDAARDELVRES